MLKLPATRAAVFILVRPHYPENVGAVARAMKVMGVTALCIVKPSRIAFPEHEMALKMAVKSTDVLLGARRAESLEEALDGVGWAYATTSRRGVSGVVSPRAAARRCADLGERGGLVAFVFGNEKTGLSESERAQCNEPLRIPIAADQPSLNLAQAAQIVAYELFVAGLERRATRPEE